MQARRVLKNAVRSAAENIRNISEQDTSSGFKTKLTRTQSGNYVDIEVMYEIYLTPREAQEISNIKEKASDLEEYSMRLFHRIKRKQKISQVVEVEVSVGLEDREKMSIDTRRHASIKYDEATSVVLISFGKKRIKATYTSNSSAKKQADPVNFHRTSAGLPSSRTHASRGDGSVVDTTIYTLSSRNEQVVTQALNSQVPISLPAVNTEIINNAAIAQPPPQYPWISDLFIDISEDEMNGYFFMNETQAILSLTEYTEYKYLVDDVVLNITPEIYFTVGNTSESVGELQKISDMSLPPDLTAYSFSTPIRSGELSFYARFASQDPISGYVMETINEIDTSAKYLSIYKDVTSNEELLKTIHRAYNKVKKLLRMPEESWESFQNEYKDETNDYYETTHGLLEYFSETSRIFRQIFGLQYDSSGVLRMMARAAPVVDVKIHEKNFSNRHSFPNKFRKSHSKEQAIYIHEELNSYKSIDRSSITVPIRSNKDANAESNDNDFPLSLFETKKVINKLNLDSLITGDVYILEGFKIGLEDGVSLLRNPKWNKITDSTISSGKYLAKAIIKDVSSDNELRYFEEYFMVTEV